MSSNDDKDNEHNKNRGKRQRSPYKSTNHVNTNSHQRSRSHSPQYRSPIKKKPKRQRSSSKNANPIKRNVIIGNPIKGLKFHAMRQNLNNNNNDNNKNKSNNKSNKKSDTDSQSLASTSSSSASSNKKPSKLQQLLPSILNFVSIDINGFNKKVNKILCENGEYILQNEKLYKLKSQLNKLSNENKENDDNDNDNDDKENLNEDSIKAAIEKCEKSIKDAINTASRSLLGKNWLIKYNKDGIYSIHNILNDDHIYPSNKATTTKRGLSTTQLLRWAMETTAAFPVLQQLKEQGTNHPNYQELIKTVNSLYHRGKCTERGRAVCLKSSKLIIKILQNENNKYNYHLTEQHSNIQRSYYSVYEPDKLEQNDNENEEQKDIQSDIIYNPIWFGNNSKSFEIGKKLIITKLAWDAKKSILNNTSSKQSEKMENDDHDEIPSTSISIEPLV